MTVQVGVELRGDNARFFETSAREAIIAGPAETGKTFAGLLKLHTLLGKYPCAQIALIRKVGKDLKSSALVTYRRDILRLESFKQPHRYITVYGGESPEWFDYPGGARLWTGGLDNPGKTLSSERDVIYVVQAEQLQLEDWEYLLRCTTGRGAVMPYTQLLGDCNPGGPAHWILSRPGLQLFHSTHQDNPTLHNADGTLTPQGERSMRDLASMTGARYKRLYLGQWAAPEGIIYDVFDTERHKVKAFPIPASWPRIVGIDPFGDCVAALWLALDPRGQVWNVYREYVVGFGATTQGHVKAILEVGQREPIFFYVGGGPSERQARADFTGYGIPLLEPAFGDVWAQIDRVYGMLKSGQLVIHDSCPHLLSELTDYRRQTRGGQVLDGTIEDKAAFHCCDALRYALTGPAMPAEQTRVVYAPR
jgi:phage terminase large subunit